jgi:peptide chain release factor subunit 1
MLEGVPAGRAVSGLAACLPAVNAGAADVLLIPDEELVPGFVCGRCGALTITGDDCPDWGTAARPVPDLLEEMAARVLEDGGQVVVVRAPLSVAARLRYPIMAGQ